MTVPAAGTVIGVTGSPARAVVTPWGALRFEDGRRLDWWIAADDRWHVPEQEASVRQRLLEGTPVVETAIRVPKGAVEQRVYGAVGGDGLAVVEVENRSPLPVAVVVSRRDMLSPRAPTPVPPGVDVELPEHAVSYPLGHGACVHLALPLGRGRQPVVSLPSAREVVRGWRRRVDVGPRIDVPDARLAESLVTARCRMLLDPPPSLDDDPAGAIMSASERVRLREPIGVTPEAAAAAVTRWGRAHRRQRHLVWTDAVMLERVAELLDAAHQPVAAGDARRLRARWPAGPMPDAAPDGGWRLAWSERMLVATEGDEIELLAGLPTQWFGQPIEAHDIPVGNDRLSFALRWHGARPALLWECTAPRPLRCSRLDTAWSTSRARGEALLAPPAA